MEDNRNKNIEKLTMTSNLAELSQPGSSESSANSSHTIPDSEFDDLTSNIEKGENQILKDLLNKVLLPTFAFSGGTQKLMDVVVNQLQLTDVELSGEKYQPIIQMFTDIKVFLIFIKLSMADETRSKQLEDLELQLYIKVIQRFLGLAEDPTQSEVQQQVNNLNNLLISFLKDFNIELAKNQKEASLQNNLFLKDLKLMLKRDEKKEDNRLFKKQREDDKPIATKDGK